MKGIGALANTSLCLEWKITDQGLISQVFASEDDYQVHRDFLGSVVLLGLVWLPVLGSIYLVIADHGFLKLPLSTMQISV